MFSLIFNVVGVMLNVSGLLLALLTHRWFFAGWCAGWLYYFIGKFLEDMDKLVGVD